MYKLHGKCPVKKDTAQVGSASGHRPQHTLIGRAREKLAPRGEVKERWALAWRPAGGLGKNR